MNRIFADTNVLFPFSVTDLLLAASEDGLHELIWTDALLNEWEDVIVREHKRMKETAAAIAAAIREFFPDSKIERRVPPRRFGPPPSVDVSSGATPLGHAVPMDNNVPASAPRQVITLDRPGSVTTESSVYAFDGRCRYQRLPRRESGPRPATPCIDDSLDDGRWIEYREVWIESHPFVPGCYRLGIVPSQRPEDFRGIRTGVIVASTYEFNVD